MCVESAGLPPSLTSQMTLKLLNVQITPSEIAGIITGFSSGAVIVQNCRQGWAPSTSAAS